MPEESEAKLFFRDVGFGSPVILLHGHQQSHRVFRGIEQYMMLRHRLILIDSRGHGKSGRGHAPFLIVRMAKDVVLLMDRLGIERSSIIGFSDGANIALRMGIDFPERVAAIVAISGNARPEGLKPLYLKVFQLWKRLLVALRMKSDVMDLLLKQPQISGDALESIKAPTLLIYGGLDLIKKAHIRELHERIPGARLKIIRGALHSTIVSQWRRYATDIERFIFRAWEASFQ